MNENDLDLLVRRLSDRLPDTSPAVAELERGGTARRRRRRLIISGGVAALVASALVAVPVVRSVLEQSPVDGVAAPVDSGVRLVGLGRVAVEVPDRLEVDDSRCPDLRKPDQLFIFSTDADCPGGESETRTGVEIGHLSGPEGKNFRKLPESARTIDGHPVTGPEFGTCLGNVASASSCPPEQIYAVPDLDVYLVIIGTAAEIATIARSLQIVPDGYAAIPDDPDHDFPARVGALAAAGFSIAASQDVESTYGLDPPIGTIVPIGSTITVSASDLGVTIPVTPGQAAPGDTVTLELGATVVHGIGSWLEELTATGWTRRYEMVGSRYSTHGIAVADVAAQGPITIQVPEVTGPGLWRLCPDNGPGGCGLLRVRSG